MKNKKLTYYVLIPSVIIIWGLIIYKIVMRDNGHIQSNDFSRISKVKQAVIEKNTYQLLDNYPDPFFCDYSQSDERFSSDDQEVVLPKSEKKWPAIRFNGYILNGKKIKCHLTINGEEKILQVNEKVTDDYIVSVITPDSVKIDCQSSYQWFKK